MDDLCVSGRRPNFGLATGLRRRLITKCGDSTFHFEIQHASPKTTFPGQVPVGDVNYFVPVFGNARRNGPVTTLNE
jgi:hypothetical protein